MSPLIIAPLVTLTACSAQSPTPDPAPEPTVSSSPTVALPDSPVGEAAAWVLNTLAADSGPTAEEAEQRFAPVFLEQVPADQAEAVFTQLRGAGPFTLTEWQDEGRRGKARLGSDQGDFDMQISVDEAGLIDGLLFTPAEETPEVTDPAEASRALADRAQHSSFLWADGTCTPIEVHDENTVLPIGSMFKLYVLGAVVSGVEQGTIGWDDELTITEELKSLPSGTLQDEEAGTTVTVAEAARLMISISDNTATDLLIHHVGRDAVEAEVAAMGHHEPELMKPFLTTREMFQIALSDADLRQQWATATGSPTEADPAVTTAQREIVEGLPSWDRQFNEELFATPFWDEGLDWFASATDLCRAHANLQERAGTAAGEPVREILSENPGVPVDDAEYLGFKGGSSVGEIGLSFWIERGDETRVLVMQTAADQADGVPGESWIADLAGQVLNAG
ncbi:MAG: serine hydrolase [Propionibacterium sp.]|nr:serine hydrolase [Propionibacterium sp.]